MALPSSPIPTIDVLPPMSEKVRDVFYGVLAWAAVLLSVATAALAAYPDTRVPTALITANTIVMALWALLGFKAKANVQPDGVVEEYRGQHEGPVVE